LDQTKRHKLSLLRATLRLSPLSVPVEPAVARVLRGYPAGPEPRLHPQHRALQAACDQVPLCVTALAPIHLVRGVRKSGTHMFSGTLGGKGRSDRTGVVIVGRGAVGTVGSCLRVRTSWGGGSDGGR